MPVQQYFADQLRQMTEFMADPSQTVRVVHVDVDMKPVLRKMLAGYDRDPASPHVILPSTAAFDSPAKFSAALLDDLMESYAASADDLLSAGIHEPFTRRDLGRDPADRRVVLYLCSLAEGLPDHVGSLVVTLDPERVADPVGYRTTLARLADDTWSPWVKFLVIDDRVNPLTAGLEELSPKVGRQTLHLPPDALEKRIRDAVAIDKTLPANVLRQYLGMLAGFALVRKDYAFAAEQFGRQVEMARRDAPQEESQALYGLGNVKLAQGDYAAAEEAYTRSIELTLAHNQPQLRGLVLVQLGVALDKLGRAEESAQSLAVARDTARSVNAPPLEAFALDTQARCHQAANRPADAERCWKEALAVYDGITSDDVRDVRTAGRKDVLTKLEVLYQTTRQPHKWAELVAARGGE